MAFRKNKIGIVDGAEREAQDRIINVQQIPNAPDVNKARELAEALQAAQARLREMNLPKIEIKRPELDFEPETLEDFEPGFFKDMPYIYVNGEDEDEEEESMNDNNVDSDLPEDYVAVDIDEAAFKIGDTVDFLYGSRMLSGTVAGLKPFSADNEGNECPTYRKAKTSYKYVIKGGENSRYRTLILKENDLFSVDSR